MCATATKYLIQYKNSLLLSETVTHISQNCSVSQKSQLLNINYEHFNFLCKNQGFFSLMKIADFVESQRFVVKSSFLLLNLKFQKACDFDP